MIKLSTSEWSIENIDTIFFDKDGTLIDLHYFWGKMTELRAGKIVKEFKLSSNIIPELCSCLGYNIQTGRMLPNGITAMYSRSKIIEIFCSDLSNLGINTTESKIEKLFDDVSEDFYKQIEKYTKPIEDAIDFVKKIRTLGIKTGIITSDSLKSTKLTLKQYNWQGLFDVVIGRESTSSTKESGMGTRLALKKLNSNPHNTIMIGDAPMDLISATNAGIEHTILVASGQISQTKLNAISPYTVSSLNELKIY